MSSKKQTKQISKSTFYVVTIKYRLVNYQPDSFGHVTQDNPKIEVSHLVIGTKGIENVLNSYMTSCDYIFDEVTFRPVTRFKGDDGDALLNYKLVL